MISISINTHMCKQCMFVKTEKKVMAIQQLVAAKLWDSSVHFSLKQICLFVCMFVLSSTINCSAIWRLSLLPVTGAANVYNIAQTE
jgi:hypothetical protein